jgi:hypothetical protein
MFIPGEGAMGFLLRSGGVGCCVGREKFFLLVQQAQKYTLPSGWMVEGVS